MHFMRFIIAVILLMASFGSKAFDIALMPLHSFAEQIDKNYGKNISLHGTPQQISKLKYWLSQIASVPKGLDTLIKIQNSGHKLFIYHSDFSLVSSGRTSAPASANLINGKGESVDIHFNALIPDAGSHQVYTNKKLPIEYTATQNLYHELAHALHMMNGTWMYFKSERQAIMEENIFRKQMAEMLEQPYQERVYVSGLPICPDTREENDSSWKQELICKQDRKPATTPLPPTGS